MKPKVVVECGTAIGYSGLWIARETSSTWAPWDTPGGPSIVYSLATGASYGGATHFTINNVKTGQTEPRSVWPEILFGTPASEFKYRFNWQAPFLVSPHDPTTIYMAANVVFRTRDEGR